MDMTKFSSSQNDGYQNVLAELKRMVQAIDKHPQEPLSKEMSTDVSRPKEQPVQPVNNFSGTFNNSSGGKLFQGGTFNGAMSF